MEVYSNRAGDILSVEGLNEGMNLTVKIVSKGKGESVTVTVTVTVRRDIGTKELNSMLYNGSYNLITTDRRIKPFSKAERSPQLYLSDFGVKEIVFNRGGFQYTGWLAGYDKKNGTFVVRTGAEWGYRLTELSPSVMYVKGETNINCRMADIPYNDIIFLQW